MIVQSSSDSDSDFEIITESIQKREAQSFNHSAKLDVGGKWNDRDLINLLNFIEEGKNWTDIVKKSVSPNILPCQVYQKYQHVLKLRKAGQGLEWSQKELDLLNKYQNDYVHLRLNLPMRSLASIKSAIETYIKKKWTAEDSEIHRQAIIGGKNLDDIYEIFPGKSRVEVHERWKAACKTHQSIHPPRIESTKEMGIASRQTKSASVANQHPEPVINQLAKNESFDPLEESLCEDIELMIDKHAGRFAAR